jgi:transcriptional regulator with XRE-family HTH domain
MEEEKKYKYADFGKLLRKWRKIKYGDIKSFSKVTGISEPLLYQYEIGRNFPPIENFITICKYLEKSPSYMLSPFIELNHQEQELLTIYEETGLREMLQDEEVAKRLKFTLLGFQLLFQTKKHFNHSGDVMSYLNDLKEKLFVEGQLKKIK